MKSLNAPQLVKIITKAYINKQGVFQKQINAENHIPQKATPKQKALFLFYVIQIDYATKSQRLYKGAKRLWDYNRNYFKPKVIINTSDKQLLRIFNKFLKPRYINEALKRWKDNSQVLLNDYKGNPINIFKNTRNAIEVEKRIRTFRGFGPKIGNFFFRSMVNTFNYKLINIDKISQPVDIHDVRLTYQWGLIDSDKMTQKNINKVKKIWQKACRKAKVSWLVFDKALWVLGSEGVKTDNPQDDLITNLDIKNSI